MWKAIALQMGLVLMFRWISGEKDSSEIEKKILTATSKDEIIALVAGEVLAEALKGEILPPDAENLIEALAKATDKEALIEIVNTPETKGSIIDGIWDVITLGLFKDK